MRVWGGSAPPPRNFFWLRHYAARTLTEREQAEYKNEKKVLTMEENLLYNLVDYLQVTGHIKTNPESGSSATTTTEEQ